MRHLIEDSQNDSLRTRRWRIKPSPTIGDYSLTLCCSDGIIEKVVGTMRENGTFEVNREALKALNMTFWDYEGRWRNE